MDEVDFLQVAAAMVERTSQSVAERSREGLGTVIQWSQSAKVAAAKVVASQLDALMYDLAAFATYVLDLVPKLFHVMKMP